MNTKELAGYKIKEFSEKDTIPVGSIFMESRKQPSMWGAQSKEIYAYKNVYVFMVPNYEQPTKTKKRTTPK